MMIKRLLEGANEVRAFIDGPTVAVVGGVHGNEKTGVAVVESLRALFASRELVLRIGRVLLVIGNPRAVAEDRRYSADGADLNRQFTDAALHEEPTTYEGNRAQLLAGELAHVNIAIDIHATSKPSAPFVICQRPPDAAGRRIIRWLGVERLIADPQLVFGGGEPVTLDEYVTRHGGVGVCYETGFAADMSRVDEVRGEVLNVLMDLGMIEGWPTGRLVRKELFELTRAFRLTDRGFAWETDMGAFNFQPVESGQVIGWHGAEPEAADASGVIIFPKARDLWQVGQPLGYLARLVA